MNAVNFGIARILQLDKLMAQADGTLRKAVDG